MCENNNSSVVLITGAGGRIAYSLVTLIGVGATFGCNKKIDLILFDLPQCESILNGLRMEIEDSLFPCIASVKCTVDPKQAFVNIDYAFMLGAFPRRAGMDRSDLLAKNISIFIEQGKLIDEYAKKTVKVLVVGNPANTNCYVLIKHAPSIPRENFSAMSRLDHNRLIGQISLQTKASFDKIHHATVWGNHSATQFPDWRNITIEKDHTKVPVSNVISNVDFLKYELNDIVAKRGEAVINACRVSSALSAAKGASDHMRNWTVGTKDGEWVSMAVSSNGKYGVPEGLVFSFPVTCKGGKFTIVDGIEFDNDSIARLKRTQDELMHERDIAHSHF